MLVKLKRDGPWGVNMDHPITPDGVINSLKLYKIILRILCFALFFPQRFLGVIIFLPNSVKFSTYPFAPDKSFYYFSGGTINQNRIFFQPGINYFFLIFIILNHFNPPITFFVKTQLKLFCFYKSPFL